MDLWVEECLGMTAASVAWRASLRERDEGGRELWWRTWGWTDCRMNEGGVRMNERRNRLIHLSFRANTSVCVCVCVCVSGLWVQHISILCANSNRRYVTSVNRNWAHPPWFFCSYGYWTGPDTRAGGVRRPSDQNLWMNYTHLLLQSQSTHYCVTHNDQIKTENEH